MYTSLPILCLASAGDAASPLGSIGAGSVGWSGTIAPHGPHPTKIACPTNTHMWCKIVLVCCCPLVRLPRPSTRTTRRMLCKNFQKCQHCGDGRASEPRHF